jgi:hypothetical protein
VHALGLAHIPSDPHVWTPLPEHCVCPAAHGPVHCPPAQAALGQSAASPQLPALSHVWTPVPEHCVAPGSHAPEQAPAVHPWFAHGTALPQVPFALQVWTPLLRHWVALGAQTPTQVPAMQAALPQSMGTPHCPADTHSWVAFRVQRTVPITHGAPPSSFPSSAESWPPASPSPASGSASVPSALESAAPSSLPPPRRASVLASPSFPEVDRSPPLQATVMAPAMTNEQARCTKRRFFKRPPGTRQVSRFHQPSPGAREA